MKASFLACVIVVAISGGGLAPAFGATAQDFLAEEPAATEVDQLFEDYDQHLFARDFEQLLSVTNKLEPHAEHDEGRAAIAAMQAVALFGLDRNKEATELVEKAERLAPHVPGASYSLFIGGIVADRADVAADALDRLIARFPDVVREIDSEAMSYFLLTEPEGHKARNDDRRIALARLGYGGTLKGDGLAYGAVDLLIERGDLEGASEFLPYIDEPEIVENMLIQKKYSPFWTRIEELAGTNLTKVRRSSAGEALRAYQDDPQNHDKLQNLAHALRFAGRLDEATALRSKLPPTAQALASSDEHLGWAVNNVALALGEAGRSEEADQLFAMLNEAPTESGRGRWRISMTINRVGLLVTGGKFDQALPLMEATEASARDDGNDYARQLVRRYGYCTRRSLGQEEEASRVLPALLEHAEDAYWATVDALVCAGDFEKAEQVAIEALKAEKSSGFVEPFVRSLQPRLLTADEATPWRSRWLEFRRRPAIAQAYERIARDMPETFLPASR